MTSKVNVDFNAYEPTICSVIEDRKCNICGTTFKLDMFLPIEEMRWTLNFDIIPAPLYSRLLMIGTYEHGSIVNNSRIHRDLDTNNEFKPTTSVLVCHDCMNKLLEEYDSYFYVYR